MTRINVVPVEELNDIHLRSEFREITRIPNHLVKVNFKPKLKDQPSSYTLGTGHVRFFYDKMQWIENRFNQLKVEMTKRGFKADKEWNYVFPNHLYKTFTVTEECVRINRERIKATAR